MGDDVMPFECPSCGGMEFRTAGEVKSHEDLAGAVCVGCGREIEDDDIKRKAVDMAKALLADAFKDLKL